MTLPLEKLMDSSAHNVYMLLAGVNIKGKREHLLLGFLTFGKVAPTVI